MICDARDENLSSFGRPICESYRLDACKREIVARTNLSVDLFSVVDVKSVVDIGFRRRTIDGVCVCACGCVCVCVCV